MNSVETATRSGPFKHPRLLLCEGEDDLAFFHRLILDRFLQKFHIRSTANKKGMSGGNTKFESALEAIKGNRRYDVLRNVVLVSDNDDDPDSSFQKLRKQIIGAGFQAPEKRLEQGPGIPAITIIMVPLNGMNGNLECLCKEAAQRKDSTVASHTDHFLAQLNADNWPTTRQGKLWLRANIAARATDPCVSLGGVFRDPKHFNLIPLRDRSFDCLVEVLCSIGRSSNPPLKPSGVHGKSQLSQKRDQTPQGPQMRPRLGRSR